MSSFLIRSATSQSSRYPILLTRLGGPRPRPNPHLNFVEVPGIVPATPWSVVTHADHYTNESTGYRLVPWQWYVANSWVSLFAPISYGKIPYNIIALLSQMQLLKCFRLDIQRGFTYVIPRVVEDHILTEKCHGVRLDGRWTTDILTHIG